MLIDSTRLTEEDRSAWAALSRSFRQPSWEIMRRVEKAKRIIEDTLSRGKAYVSVSWGKDSLVVAHLTRMVDPNIPLVWLRLVGVENPEQFSTRDAYLTEYPSNYIELKEKAIDEGGSDWTTLTNRVQGYGIRIAGIRAAESSLRSISMGVHGYSTTNTCRPIIDWSTKDVFAYLLHFDVPIPATYAMSNGGRLNIERLRTDFLGDEQGRDLGRRDWERNYFGVYGWMIPPTPNPDEE
jgi:phosphoadenosine phosphosulfate reductase